MFAMFQAAFALIARQMGRILNTAFGWATAMLFGKVPQDRQIYLSGIALLSVVWFLLVVGVAFPQVGAILLAFVPIPEWVNPNWVRLGMLVAAVILPAVVGGLSIIMLDPPDRPHTAGGIAKMVVKGYPYTIGLALALLMMIVAAPIIKLKDLYRRWTSRHVPVVIEADDYEEVVRHLEKMLDKSALPTARGKADALLRIPTRVFSLLAGSSSDQLVAKNLAALRGDNFEVLVHPSDLVIRGRDAQVAIIYGTVNEHLAFAKVYMTWTKESHLIEDQLSRISHEIAKARTIPMLRELQLQTDEQRRLLAGMNLTVEEWDVLFREVLLINEAIFRRSQTLPDPQDRLAHRPMGREAFPRSENGHSRFAQPHASPVGNNQGALPLLSMAATAVTLGTMVWRSWRTK